MARSKKKTQAKSRSSKAKRPAKARKVVKKASAKRAAARKPAKKSSGKKATAKKATAKRPAKKVAAKQVVEKKVAAKKPAGKPGTRKPGAGLSGRNAEVLSRAHARAEAEGLLARLPPPVVPIFNILRNLVREAAPEAVERIEGNAPAYFAGGMFARIEPRDRDVLLRFIKGTKLPSGMLLDEQGDDGTVALTSLDSVRASVLRTLVREAVMMNLDKAPKPDAPKMPVKAGQALA